MDVPPSSGAYRIGLDESYRPLPSLYLAFLSIWLVSACSWTVNTYKNRHFQTNNLQWMLASVPLIKALQLTLSFLFWYSCFNLQVLLLLNYFTSFYVIFHHISQNLSVLREQLSYIEDEDVHALHDSVYAKYMMFKKFQAAMQVVAMAESVIYINMDDSSETYWLRLLVREWAQFSIFMYIGWTFRSQDLTQRFSVMPSLKSKGQNVVPPIYSIEMDAATFKDFSSHPWHIGVPTSPSCDSSKDAILVIVQYPHAYSLTAPDASASRAGVVTSLTDPFSCKI
ncbi:uncharacterized protein LOC132188240 isoform X2 [Corylus avellana]|uniref:uncharacterized protein LOC132188240 isoform X2 n=1 Tax=Corylus avellana TaxID=13451 RepID=UPI00286C2DD6|nr:uncharacterized protein LOC132188240 isoform X2 [Corylus avellana]